LGRARLGRRHSASVKREPNGLHACTLPGPASPLPAARSSMGFPDESPSDDDDDQLAFTAGHNAVRSTADVDAPAAAAAALSGPGPARSSSGFGGGAPSCVGSLSPPRRAGSRAASGALGGAGAHVSSFSSAGSARSGGGESASTTQCSSSLWGDAPDGLMRHKTAAALWELDMDEIEVTRKIGEGSFGEVLLGTFRGTKVSVVVGRAGHRRARGGRGPWRGDRSPPCIQLGQAPQSPSSCTLWWVRVRA
jgi:hypothetical protein